MTNRPTRRNGFVLTASCVVLTIVLAAGLLFGPATALAQDARRGGDEVSVAQTVENIEIMRLVIVRVLKESVHEYVRENAPQVTRNETEPEPEPAPEPQSQSASGLATAALMRSYAAQGQGFTYSTGGRSLLMSQVTSNTRGFYAEGVGALFSTEVAVPVRSVKVADAPDDGKIDHWREAEREHHGGSSATLFRSATSLAGQGKEPTSRLELDADAVDAAIDAVIASIGTYGANIEGLRDDESIIVAMQFEGSGSVANWTDGAGNTQAGWWAVSGIYGGDATSSAVVRLSVSDIRQFAGGQYNLNTLRSRAVVTRY